MTQVTLSCDSDDNSRHACSDRFENGDTSLFNVKEREIEREREREREGDREREKEQLNENIIDPRMSVNFRSKECCRVAMIGR